MLARHDRDDVLAPFDPSDWEYRVRMHDRTWLTRPQKVEGGATPNTPPFSAVIPDSWSFDDPASARRAALSHGAVDGTFDVIPAPRDPGAWLAKSSPAALAGLVTEERAAEQAGGA